MQAPNAWVVPIAIFIGSAIVLPAVVALGKRMLQAWRDHRHKILAESFCTRKEVEVQFQTLSEVQAKQHAENQKALDALRMDGKEREGRIAGLFEAMHREVKEEGKELRENVGQVHSRVDSLFGVLQDRRRRE